MSLPLKFSPDDVLSPLGDFADIYCQVKNVLPLQQLPCGYMCYEKRSSPTDTTLVADIKEMIWNY